MTDAMVEAVARDLAKVYRPKLFHPDSREALREASPMTLESAIFHLMANMRPLATAAIAAMQAHMVPVGWRYTNTDGSVVFTSRPAGIHPIWEGWTETPLYTFGEPK